MPGVDYSAVEARVPMAKVLELLGFAAEVAATDQFRGPCPVRGSQSPHSRSFSANFGARCMSVLQVRFCWEPNTALGSVKENDGV